MDGELGQRLQVDADAQVIPGPERIVRALAAAPEPAYEAGETYCSFCGVLIPIRPLFGEHDPAADHDPTCPWRLAREWVAANPA
jgi:hypothetical protein